MSNRFGAILLFSIFAIVSCKKTSDNNSKELTLIQHKWSVVSQNGEVFRYVGTTDDYFNFAPDNFLYTYVNKKYDTSYYTLLPNGNTLALHLIRNSMISDTAANYFIDTLSETQLVISTNVGPALRFTDSLRR